MKFVFDLDGTICFKGQPLSEKICRALISLTNAGHEVIFASARPIRDMLPVIDPSLHHYTMIGGNGSLISKDGTIIQSNSFSLADLSTIFSLIDEFEATYLIDGEWDYAYTGPSKHPIFQNVDPLELANLVPLHSLQPIVKILLLSSTNMNALEEELQKLQVVVHSHRNENILDVSPPNIDKWRALKSIHIEEKSYIAFGNDANDRSMFENAYYSVMIGQHEQLEPLANDQISLDGDYEQHIVEKLEQLSAQFSYT